MSMRVHSEERRPTNRHNAALLCVAGGAALVALVAALGTPGDRPAEPQPLMLMAAAPAAMTSLLQQPAALDFGVEWSRVSDEREVAGASIAAYEQ
jgi:NhaP-type Na+/H+ or K+/H+ antiporter